jgi:hypothetical protein
LLLTMLNYTIEVNSKKYHQATRNLTDEQIGAFIKLIFQQAEHGGEIHISVLMKKLNEVTDYDVLFRLFKPIKGKRYYYKYPHVNITYL